ncbi:hypothetical protein C5E08_13885 [Rathayibacter iranicus]|uniref:A-factor biosynthesis hotdog domain-containing protein n=1 Tax=Rathayibacter iranicus TaxID=59737 RepID=A0AAD1AEQ9_9MICO|nr:hypothetical protein C7V51_14130 [Rathayibacter iranicus]MWV29483.1 hypothetical protein [Rathayibacter iranicus NCPPB 2253 = VKM Ac-1602]PPI42397.1 hypothetical protein C5E09_12985 [Rathayibacter iranicus]PPI57819.1 hypothetical protein C5E08_13885 [Rathayibacter iranicus]PPI68757.1 hypothetical protein C5E01_12940 [Rathayibacter iranicus]
MERSTQRSSSGIGSTELTLAQETTLSGRDPSDRSVSAQFAHRHTIGEIFLVGQVVKQGDLFISTGQVPRSNLYFNDHLGRESGADPLVLIEMVRQTASCIAHEYFSVPLNYKFVLNRLDFDINEISADQLGERRTVTLVSRPSIERHRRGIPLAVSMDVDLVHNGMTIGRVSYDTTFLSPSVYSALRESSVIRGGVSEPAVEPTAVNQILARSVGRLNPVNIVISDPTITGADTLECVVEPHFSNPSMFEHGQDHVPGMVILEAARQAAALQVGVSPRLLSGTLVFHRFIETDVVVRLRSLLSRNDEDRRFFHGDVRDSDGEILTEYRIAVREEGEAC